MRRAAGALVVALAVAGCGAGAPAHDLFLVQRGGAIPGAKLALRFADDSRGQPPALIKLAKLTRDVARGSCHLAR